MSAQSMKPNVRTQLALLRPTGEVAPNGLASWYDDAFPPACAPHLTPDEFARAMTKINEALTDHWPCVPCSAFGLGCCVCTLGLSLYCASTQVAEAEARAQLQIRRVNAQRNLRAKGVEFRLVRVWYTRRSYVEITLGPPAAVSDDDRSGDVVAEGERGDVAAAPETQSMHDRLV